MNEKQKQTEESEKETLIIERANERTTIERTSEKCKQMNERMNNQTS